MIIGRSALTLLSLGVLFAGLFAALAGQAEARTFSTVTSFGFYSGNPDAFVGQVSSNNNTCRNHRNVKVFRERGRHDRMVGRDRATSTGQWAINLENVRLARYYAKVPRKRFGPGQRHTCRAYKSSTLKFGG